MPFVMNEKHFLMTIQRLESDSRLFRNGLQKNRPPCLWKRKSETRSTPPSSRMVLWSLRRSASETLAELTMTSRMSQTFASSRVSRLFSLSSLIPEFSKISSSLPVFDFPRLPQAAVRVATLLLGPHQRGC